MTVLGAASSLARKLPSSRTKVRLGRAVGFAASLAGAAPQVTVTSHDGTFVLDARSRTEASKLWNGTYDEDDLAFLRAVTPANGCYMDIGANVGLILIPLAHHVNRGRVIGIEPVLINADRLERALAANHLSASIEIVRTALGRHEGKLHLAKEGPAASSGNAVPTTGTANATTVAVTTLDELCDRLSVDQLDTIKIDVVLVPRERVAALPAQGVRITRHDA